MQRLRQARFLARLVLAWFALVVGVAVAAPLVNPQSVELVCSAGGGFRLLAAGEGGEAAKVHPLLDCPLCAPTGAPPPEAVAIAQLPAAAPHLSFAAAPQPTVRVPPAPPARGPPQSLAA